MSYNTAQGWIKLHRSLLEHPLWQNSTAEQRNVLITLLLLANHAEKRWEWKGKPYLCKPGQLITSLDSLRKKCGKQVTCRKIQVALNRFVSMGFMTKETSSANTKITICNWERYQQAIEDEVKPALNDCQTDGKQTLTNKNDKALKNDQDPPTIPPLGGEGLSEIPEETDPYEGMSPQARRIYEIAGEG